MEDLSAVAASASELSVQSATLAAILKATKEHTASVDKNASSLRKEILKQHAELRQDVLKQNAAILAAMQEQTRAIERQTQAIEKLAAPTRESGKRKRVEGPAADAGNQQETSATDSQTSATEKLLSSSLKGKGPAGEGTSTARRGKKMKAAAPVPAPAKEVLSVNATGPHEGTCTWTISNFSKLKVDEDGESYSDTFSIGGHQWKLCVFPRGNGSDRDKSVSLYLSLADTDKLPEDWQVPVVSTFFVICQHDPEKSHKQGDDEPDFYSAEHNAWGWHELIPLTDLHDAENGFLVNDTVIIEAKIEVHTLEALSVNDTNPLKGTCTWTIPNFSKMKVDECGRKFSDTFSIGGHEWELCVYPRGDEDEKDESVSFYMLADDHGKVTADCSLSVICQHDPEKSRKEELNNDFNGKGNGWGLDPISLADFHDAANGFLVNDTVIIEAKIEVKNTAKAS